MLFRSVNVAKNIHRLESTENANERAYYNWWRDILEVPGMKNRDRIKELRKVAGYLVSAKRGELLNPASVTKDATELEPRKTRLSTRLFKDPEERSKPGGGLVPLSGKADELYQALRNIPHYREVLEKPAPTIITPSASAKSNVVNITRPPHITPSQY